MRSESRDCHDNDPSSSPHFGGTNPVAGLTNKPIRHNECGTPLISVVHAQRKKASLLVQGGSWSTNETAVVIDSPSHCAYTPCRPIQSHCRLLQLLSHSQCVYSRFNKWDHRMIAFYLFLCFNHFFSSLSRSWGCCCCHGV